MRVAHLRWSLNYGGKETMLVNIATEQTRQGAEVVVVIINNLVAEPLLQAFAPQVRIIRIDRSAGAKSFSFQKELTNRLLEYQPDIIHLHDSGLLDFLPEQWRNNPSHVCATVHAMPNGQLGTSWRQARIVQSMVLHKGGNVINLNRVGRVFSISKAVAKALKDEYGIDSTVIYNGIHTEQFVPRERTEFKDTLQIVQVGRLMHEVKGQDLLVDAMGKLIERGINCHLTFVGDGVSRQFLEERVEKLGLKAHITFLGMMPQDYLMHHLCDYDLFVQPSRYEGFGLTVAEAMTASVPVLVSAGQGPAEVTDNERYGWVFMNGSIEALAEKIEYIYKHYHTCLVKVEDARKHVVEHFDVTATARNYMEAYQTMQKS